MTSDIGKKSSRRVVSCLAVGLLCIHTFLLGWAAFVNGPNLDEPAHLASGINHWTSGHFDLYKVNPPLVRMVAAAPIMLANPKTDWSPLYIGSPYFRPEWQAGKRFVILNEMAGFWYLTVARWCCIPLCLIGLWTVFIWGRVLFGNAAGLTGMFLYCFCPNMIAWGSTITPDAVGASLGVFAAYIFWKWLRRPDWLRALMAGLVLGLAELAKGTWIVLFGLWPALWIATELPHATRLFTRNGCIPKRPIANVGSWTKLQQLRSVQQLAMILLIGIYTLNLGYGFEGTFTRLGEFRFVSKSLSGQTEPPDGENRFSGTWLANLPVPLPRNYVLGVDYQKFDFERGKWSYLCGEQANGGWWYYYLVAFVVKTPLGLLVVLAVSTLLMLMRQFRAEWTNEIVILVPAITILLLVSSQTGFSRHFRYVLPMFPFLFMHVGRIAILLQNRISSLTPFAIIALAGTAAETLSTFPHSASFFNLTVGGPLNGYRYLLDSNIDWGQDLLFLKRWYDEHLDARPLHLAYFGERAISPDAAGIAWKPVPGVILSNEGLAEYVDGIELHPGWFAVSINHVRGYHHFPTDMPKFTYFQLRSPSAHAGYSINIYHLDQAFVDALQPTNNSKTKDD